MNILVLTPFLPDPAAPAGCPRAVFDRVALLSRAHTVTVACFMTPTDPPPAALTELGVRLVTAPHVDAASRSWTERMVNRTKLVVGLVRPTPALAQEFGAMRRIVRGLVADGSYDLILVEHLLMAQYLRDLPAGRRAVVSDHDVRYAFPDPGELPVGGRRVLREYDQRRWRAYAAAAYRRADVVLVPTPADRDWLTAHVADVKVGVVGFGITGVRSPAGSASTRSEDVALFVGNFAHPPNRDAAAWLVEEIMPVVRANRPAAQVWLVGKDPPAAVTAMGGPGVTVVGEVPEVASYLATCTVFVAPLRQGGGLRIKILEALAAGTPVVTTTRGLAGIDVPPDDGLLVADGTAAFAAAIEHVLSDPARAAGCAAGRVSTMTDDPDARLAALERAMQSS